MSPDYARRAASYGLTVLIWGALGLYLAGCGTTPAQQASLTQGAATLGAVAAAHNTTVASLVKKGALFCQKASTDASLVVAVANLSGVPVTVTDIASEVVAATCAGIDAVPVSPPADPAAAPIVVVPAVVPVVSIQPVK